MRDPGGSHSPARELRQAAWSLWTEVGPGPAEEGWGSGEGEKEGREVERPYLLLQPLTAPYILWPKKIKYS